MSKKSITVLLAMGMAFSVLADAHNKVQLWKDGPYWAETNIGAEKPWEYGYYFWWGDTVGYKRMNDAWVASDGASSIFSFVDNLVSTIAKDELILLQEEWITTDGVLAPKHDAAHVHWGGDWRMPTKQELNDLCYKCDWAWTTTNGVNGYVVRGRGDYSSATIFLPATGYGYRTLFDTVGVLGNYWSSVPGLGSYHACAINFYSSDLGTGYCERTRGQSVRPVQGFTKVSYSKDSSKGTGMGGPKNQTVAHKQAPNSRRTGAQMKVQLWKDGPYWAETNIGAETPWDFGYYFWWGDTIGYKRVNNVWVASDGSSSDFSFELKRTPTIDKDESSLRKEGWITTDGVLVLKHDAAYVHWGGAWRMPTCQELKDLRSRCDWKWTTTNGVNGYVVCGRSKYSSASIFLPCAGLGIGTSLRYTDSLGYYWSSVPRSEFSSYAWSAYFFLSDHDTFNYSRDHGHSVRPVQGFTK